LSGHQVAVDHAVDHEERRRRARRAVDLSGVGADTSLLLQDVRYGGDRRLRIWLALCSGRGALFHLDQSPLGAHLDRLDLLHHDLLHLEIDRGGLSGHDPTPGQDCGACRNCTLTS
jgi:hypothetical protein